MQLSPECARVLGSLVEKGLTTPQQYLLNNNALVGGLQPDPRTGSRSSATTRREDGAERPRSVEGPETGPLRAALARPLGRPLPPGARGNTGARCAAVRHLVRAPAARATDHRRTAHPDRAHGPGSTGSTRSSTSWTCSPSRDRPLAANVGRRPGQKEERWADPAVETEVEGATVATGTRPGQNSPSTPRPWVAVARCRAAGRPAL